MPDGNFMKSVVAVGIAPYDETWVRRTAFEIGARFHEWKHREFNSGDCIIAFARNSLTISIQYCEVPPNIVEQLFSEDSLFLKILTA